MDVNVIWLINNKPEAQKHMTGYSMAEALKDFDVIINHSLKYAMDAMSRPASAGLYVEGA